MKFDWISAAALVVVGLLFGIIYLLRRKKLDFTVTVLLALAAGVGVGIAFSGYTSWIAPLGKIYVSVLTAIVPPLILVSILSSVTSLGSLAQLRSIGVRSVVWLMVTTLIAIILAMGLAMVFGVGRDSYLSVQGVNASTFKGAVVPFGQVLVGFFPRNPVSDIADERIIPMILFAVLMAVSYVLVAHDRKEQVAPFKNLVEAGRLIVFKAVAFVIELTPYAVLALTATSMSNSLSRSGILWSLLVLLLVSFIAFAIDIWAVNAVLLRVVADIRPMAFFRKILPAQLTSFSTQSSSGTLPVTISLLTQKIGVGPEVANFTAPLGTTIGMPGCAGIWPILVAAYGVNGLGLNYSVGQWVTLGLIGLFLSMGTAGVPGTSTVVTASVLTAAGLPLEILVLVIPISAIADTGRTACNVTAAAVASTIVARQVGALDEDVLYDRVPEREPDVANQLLELDPELESAGELAFAFPVGESCKL
jgi:Na+/H+-dicarboxylate symporter